MKNQFFLLLALLSLLHSCAPAKLLRTPIAYEPGYTLTIRQKTDSETTTKIFDEDQEQSSSNTTVFEYRVVELLPNGKLKWDIVITRYILSRESNGNDHHRD